MDEVMDILNKWEIFFGQRSGRQIWAAKSLWAQEEDIKNFNRDLNKVRDEIFALRNSVNALQGSLRHMTPENRGNKKYAIIHHKGILRLDQRMRMSAEFKEAIEKYGFVLLDNMFDVIVVDGVKGDK